MKKLSALLLIVLMMTLLAGCMPAADVASYNLSKEADMFRVDRRIVFVNGITDKYLMVIEGKCSLGNTDKERELSVTCKIGDDLYYKHFLGLSDNVTYIVEQIQGSSVDPYHYKVIFRPEEIVPDIEIDIR